MPEDGLHAAAMNVHPGGKQPLMRPGWFKKGPMKIKQHMVFMDGPNQGMAKGLRAVCQERFGDQMVQGKYIYYKLGSNVKISLGVGDNICTDLGIIFILCCVQISTYTVA